MAASIKQYDFNIYYMEKNGEKHLLPYAFYEQQPVFKWDIPEGFNQTSYIFQMRTFYPVLYSDNITYQCAYYNSGKQNSSIPSHTVSLNMNAASWIGLCQVRLRLFDNKENEITSHEIITNGTEYDFQGDHPQFRKWNSKNDNFYFCYDNTINVLLNHFQSKFVFSKSFDINTEQNLEYVLQISRTPLFGQGKDKSSLIEIKNISIPDMDAEINALFQEQKNEELLQEQTINTLFTNTLYYFRARCFDGYDYSDWTPVNAAKVINNKLPVPEIISVDVPYIINKDGNLQVAERSEGQMSVVIRINDNDNRYVSANLSFSMYVTEAEIRNNNYLNSISCSQNLSRQPIDYENHKENLIRARIKENLICIPTNQEITLTWFTSKEINNKENQYVYLYLSANDGNNESDSPAISTTITINNKGIGTSNLITNAIPSQWWIRGKLQWELIYPLLPVSAIKTQIKSDITTENKGGGRYMDNSEQYYHHDWAEYWLNQENWYNRRYGIKRVTQEENFTLQYYPKYPNSWNNIKENNEITGQNYYYDPENIQTVVISNKAGFVLFCPECDEIQALKTVVIKQDNTVYDDVKTAFNIDKFDGTPYKLGFRCPKCKKIYPMDVKYQDMDFTAYSYFKKHSYSFYKGYNLTNDYMKEKKLKNDLLILRQDEYNAIQNEYKEQHPGEQKTPYTYEIITSRDLFDNIEGQIWGIMPQDLFYYLEQRPELQTFMKIYVPKTSYKHHVSYVDGTKLNYDITKDYMHNFQETQVEDEHNNIITVPSDEDMIKLSKQGLWNYYPELTFIYTDCKVSETGENINESNNVEVIADAENEQIGLNYYSNNDYNFIDVFQRICFISKIIFPITIQRNVNDRYKIIINDKDIYEGSILEGYDEDIIKIYFPYELNSNRDKNSYAGYIEHFFNKMFYQFFDFYNEVGNEEVLPPYHTYYQGYIKQYKNHVDEQHKTIIINKFSRMDKTLHKIELRECQNSCYKTFNLIPFISYQSYKTYNAGTLIRNEVLTKNNYYNNKYINTNKYHYLQYKTKNYYFCSESPVDNTIQSSFGKFNGEASGQPLFTCYKDEVDKNGYHFRYTEEDFNKTKKIYVRKFHIETCNPLPNGSFGYRDWIVIPISGKEGRYYKKKVLNCRGLAYKKQMIDKVLVNEQYIQEWGYFDYNDNCISHKKPDVREGETEPDYYIRQDIKKWPKKINPKTCIVFEYVDIFEAFNKNELDYIQGIPPFNHHCPIVFNGGVFLKDLIKRYGIYMMGAYDLTEEQKKQKNDGLPYYKTFASSSLELDSNGEVIEVWHDYEVQMENNWEPNLINGFFTIEQDKSSSKQFNIIDQKGQTSKTKVNSYQRYKKAWSNKIKPISKYILSQLTVSQFNPVFRNHIRIYNKYGYQPEKKLNDYFKIDKNNIYGEQYIPEKSRMVHFLHNDPFIDYRLKIYLNKERYLISDKSFIRTDDNYDKIPYIDYRLTGKITGDTYKYFSGLPRYQHESYQYRPEIVYDFDRPIRIGGLNKKELIDLQNENNQNNSENLVQNKNLYEVQPGAYIYFLTELLASKWTFYFLQKEWNTYNRIHWGDVQSPQQQAILYAQEINEQGQDIGSPFSVKTKTSYWNEDNSWHIPYNEKMTDMIDSTDNYNQLKSGHNYKFAMKFKNSTIESDSQILSAKFLISNVALSPANIVDTSYDPWTKDLTIKFRLDDANGNKYDIIKILYTIKENVQSAGIEQDENWSQINLGSVKGKITNLSSNINGDNVISDNFIIFHTIKINVSNLISKPTSFFRINIQVALNADTQGLTLPVFYVKMWANEFLKPVEQNLRQLQGYKSQWIWVQTLDEQTSKTTGEWKYVEEDKAVVVIGKLQEVQQNINELEEEIKIWYQKKALFIYPDLDCFEHYIYNNNKWEDFYYSYIFYTYLALKGNEYKKDYKEYILKYNDNNINNNGESIYHYKETVKNQNWLYKRNYITDYNDYYNKYRLDLLRKYLSVENNDSAFQTWFNSHHQNKTYQEMRSSFIKNYENNYKKYFNINTDSESSEEFNPADENIIEFITGKKLEQKFIEYCANKFMTMDTRFEQRAYLLYKNFNVNTVINNNDVLFAHQEELNHNEYDNWLSLHGNKFDNDSDKYQAFLLYESENYYEINIIEKQNYESYNSNPEITILNHSNLDNASVTNYGKTYARSSFLRSTDQNGTVYSMKYQALNESYNNYYKQFVLNMQMKNKLETDFRINLIKQGYFCNGFENNLPYKESGEINTCFRWRVETRPYEGNIESNTVYDEDENSVYGYQTRFDMYIRFQMDFYDTFDSQNGYPLRDIIYVLDEKSENQTYKRIKASINDADDNARTTPNEQNRKVDSVDIPNMSQSIYENKNTNTAYDPKSLQFEANFKLSPEELPGRLNTDILPEAWQNVWNLDKQTDTKDDFKSAYYWRTAPYNVLDKPILEKPLILSYINSNKQAPEFDNASWGQKHEAFFYAFYHLNEIEKSVLNDDYYYAYEKLQNPNDKFFYQNYSSFHNDNIWTVSFRNFNKGISNSIESEQGNYILQSNSSFNIQPESSSSEQTYTGYNILNIPYRTILTGEEYNVNSNYMFTIIVKTTKNRYNQNPRIHDYYIECINILKPFIGCNDGGIGTRLQDCRELILYSPDNETERPVISRNINTSLWHRIDVLCNNGTYTYRYNKINSTDNSTLRAWNNANSHNGFFIECPDGYRNIKVAFIGYLDHYPTDEELLKSDIDCDEILSKIKATEKYDYTNSCKWLKNSESVVYNIESNFRIYNNFQGNNAIFNWMNIQRLERGQVQFITDRPRCFQYKSTNNSNSSENSNIKKDYIRDNINNFDTSWIPFSPIRYKPFIINLGVEYLLFSHKIKSSGYIDGKSYSQNVITLSRGYNTNIFGEESMCFPKYTYLNTEDIIPEALSFENPCVIKINETQWRMYFDVRFYDNKNKNFYKKIYKADTFNFDDWTDFQEVILKEHNNTIINSITPFVYINENNQYELYVSNKMGTEQINTIKCFISNDGINFNYNMNITNESDGYYNAYSPCLIQTDENKKKLFFAYQCLRTNEEIIVSLEQYKLNNQWYWRNQPYDDNSSRFMIQKCEDFYLDENNIITYKNKPFGNDLRCFHNSYYSNPMVIQDNHYGCQVLRLYYNTYDEPYLWHNKELIKLEGQYEPTIHTEYYEEYNWEKIPINEYTHRQYAQASIEQIIQGNVTWNDFQWNQHYFPVSKNNLYCIKLDWRYYNNYVNEIYTDKYKSCYAIKVLTQPVNQVTQCLAQGKWIEFDNINNTQALFKPENYDCNYDLLNYSASNYIIEKDLINEYMEWIQLPENQDAQNLTQQESMIKFLIKNHYYPKYLWWSRQGPCIYKYIGWHILHKYQW